MTTLQSLCVQIVVIFIYRGPVNDSKLMLLVGLLVYEFVCKDSC